MQERSQRPLAERDDLRAPLQPRALRPGDVARVLVELLDPTSRSASGLGKEYPLAQPGPTRGDPAYYAGYE